MGKYHPFGLARSRDKGIARLCDMVKGTPNIQDVAIVHSTTPEDARLFKERTGSILGKEHIRIAILGTALGVHGGPGTLIMSLQERETEVTTKAATEKESWKRSSLL